MVIDTSTSGFGVCGRCCCCCRGASVTTVAIVGMTLFLQYYMFTLLIQDEIGSELVLIPPCASAETYTAYYVATIISLFHQHDLLMTLHVLLSLDVDYNDEKDNGSVSRHQHRRCCRWFLSFLLRGLVAVYTFVMTFWVIHASATVLDLLLNLLATEGVAGLDNYVLTWAEYGFLGPSIQHDAQRLHRYNNTHQILTSNVRRRTGINPSSVDGDDNQSDKSGNHATDSGGNANPTTDRLWRTNNRNSRNRPFGSLSLRFSIFQALVLMLFTCTSLLIYNYKDRPCIADHS